MTMPPRKTKHDSHFLLVPMPVLERNDHTTSLDRLKCNSDVVKKDSFPRRKLCRVETSQHPAGKVAQQYQCRDGEQHHDNCEACERHTNFQSSVLLRNSEVRTCRQYQQRFRRQEPKFDERLFDTTNNSVLSFQTSQGCFGRSKQPAHIAAAAGCTERAAIFYLAGERQWSGDALAAIVTEILRRHASRNVKVVPRR